MELEKRIGENGMGTKKKAVKRATIRPDTRHIIARILETKCYGSGYATQTYISDEENELLGKSYDEVLEMLRSHPMLENCPDVQTMSKKTLMNMRDDLKLWKWIPKGAPRDTKEAQDERTSKWMGAHAEDIFQLVKPFLDEWFKEKVSIKSLMEEDWGEGPQ
jgi:Zn-dependent M32 family carboxypeptidase